MINNLDKLNSKAEYVARFLEIMPFEVLAIVGVFCVFSYNFRQAEE